MATKKAAKAEARKLRKKYPNKTVNVKEITKGNWGVRFSPKGKRDSYKLGGRKEDIKQRRKHKRGGRIEAYTFGEASRGKDWPFS